MLPNGSMFRTAGPAALTSAAYAKDINEVKAIGAANSTTRTTDQTQAAIWWHDRRLGEWEIKRQLVTTQHLTALPAARMFAMADIAEADADIACFSEKFAWNRWRPITAIQLADTDGNDATEPDTGWTSLLPLPPYADEPSGANCVFSAMMNSAKAFFGSDAAEFDIVSPGLAGTAGSGSTRHYSHFTDVIPDIIDARVFGGLHFRTADVHGAMLGQSVADYVDANFFNCRNAGQCKKEERE